MFVLKEVLESRVNYIQGMMNIYSEHLRSSSPEADSKYNLYLGMFNRLENELSFVETILKETNKGGH